MSITLFCRPILNNPAAVFPGGGIQQDSAAVMVTLFLYAILRLIFM
jgi:hypothetical protein